LIEAIRRHIAVPFTLQEDPALLRKCDEPVIAGDITKFQRCSGWEAEIGLTQTIRDMLEWWRSRLAGDLNSERKFSGAEPIPV
jgi:GDP-4-dehydro-6-deoxy-D-mannose reductase